MNPFLIQFITVSMNLFEKLVIVNCDSDLKDEASFMKEFVVLFINCSNIIEVVGYLIDIVLVWSCYEYQ